MARIIIDVKEGKTDCDNCPFAFCDSDGDIICGNPIENILDCDKFDLNKIMEE